MGLNETEIRIDERGDETHESWLLVGASKISGTGVRLFDSEITHNRWVRVRVHRCKRKRNLKRDWLHDSKLLVEFDMSEAQWGAFVSSFGNGTGVPATLVHLVGEGAIPSAPFESRLAESHEEVRNAADEAFSEIKEAFDEVRLAFNDNHGKRALRAKIDALATRLQNATPNITFAAKSLTEHAENVVTKAKFDIEAMVINTQHELESGETIKNLLNPGEEHS